MNLKNIYKIFTVCLLFFLISVFVLSALIFNAKLIGRYLDFSFPPLPYLAANSFLSSLYTWIYTINGGVKNSFGTTLLPVNVVLYFPLIFKASVWFIPRYQMVLTLFFGLSFFYLLSNRLLTKISLDSRQKTYLSVLASLFFVFNNYLFSEMIFGSNVMYMTFVFVPFLIYSIVSYFEIERYKIFHFFLALFSLLIVSSVLQHLVLAYLFIIILALIYKDKKFYFWLIFLHLLLSLYWILPLFATIADVKSLELAKDYSSGILTSSSKFISSLINSDYFGNRDMYRLSLGSKILAKIWTANVFLLLFVSLFSVYNVFYFKKIQQKLIISSFFIFLFSLLFIKGARDPFGGFVLFLYNNLPLLKLFRSPQHFLSFYVISLSILFIFSGVYLLKKNKTSVLLLLILIVINAMPWWLTRDLGTRILSQNSVVPRLNQIILSKGDEEMYALNKLPLDFSMMTIPPGYSINFLQSGSNRVTNQGGDAGLALGNKRFYATDQSMVGFDNVLDNLEREMYLNDDFFDKYNNLFAYLNIKYFIVRKDTSPNFSRSINDFNFDSIEKSIKQSNSVKVIYRDDKIIILENKNFLPHIYVPCTTSKNQSISPTLNSLSSGENQICNAVYFYAQNSKETESLAKLADKTENRPTIEYKKINSTKYRLVIHGAEGNLPIVFSELFNSGWKVYQIKNSSVNKSGSESGQTKFVSENYFGTTQNDNLLNGPLFETLFKSPIESQHLTANGYANSWNIDVDKICGGNDKCSKNSDGTYNMELVVEFWPQRLFYLGLLISGVTLFGCLIYLIYRWVKNIRLKNAKKRI